MAYPIVPRVTEALNSLYSAQDSEAKKEANRWLESFQKTVSFQLNGGNWLLQLDQSNVYILWTLF